MSSFWLPLIEKTLSEQDSSTRWGVSANSVCHFSGISLHKFDWPNTLNVPEAFTIAAYLVNFDGLIPAEGRFFFPTLLPRWNPLDYSIVKDYYNHGYFITEVPCPAGMGPIYWEPRPIDPAILAIGAAKPKLSSIDTTASSLKGFEAAKPGSVPARRSGPILIGDDWDDPVLVPKPNTVAPAPEDITKREPGTNIFQHVELNVDNRVKSLDDIDLPKRWAPKTLLPDYLNLSLNTEQAENLPTLLEEVDLGRQSNVPEAYLAKAKDDRTSMKECRERHLFEDGLNALSITVSLPQPQNDSRRPSSTVSPMHIIQAEPVEATSLIDSSNTLTLRGQGDHSRQVSSGSTIVTTISSEQGNHSRQVSLGNMSITTLGSGVAEDGLLIDVKIPSFIEETPSPITEEDLPPVTGEKPPPVTEEKPLSKSQKKRKRQAKSRRGKAEKQAKEAEVKTVDVLAAQQAAPSGSSESSAADPQPGLSQEADETTQAAVDAGNLSMSQAAESPPLPQMPPKDDNTSTRHNTTAPSCIKHQEDTSLTSPEFTCSVTTPQAASEDAPPAIDGIVAFSDELSEKATSEFHEDMSSTQEDAQTTSAAATSVSTARASAIDLDAALGDLPADWADSEDHSSLIDSSGQSGSSYGDAMSTGPSNELTTHENDATSSGNQDIQSMADTVMPDAPPCFTTYCPEGNSAFDGAYPFEWANRVAAAQYAKQVQARQSMAQGDPYGNFNPSTLYFVMEHLRQPCFAQIGILQEADRSLGWFRERFGFPRLTAAIEAATAEGREDSANINHSVSVIETGSENADDYVRDSSDYHHLNFLFQKVYQKSYTTPAVSLWAAFTSDQLLQQWGYPRSLSRKAILITQAWKWVDPFWYDGPEHLLDLNGEELREQVIGLVGKVYQPFGTWPRDTYKENEDIPIPVTQIRDYYYYYYDKERTLDQYEAKKAASLNVLLTGNDISYTGPGLPLKPVSVLPRPSLLRFSETTDYGIDDAPEFTPYPFRVVALSNNYISDGTHQQNEAEVDDMFEVTGQSTPITTGGQPIAINYIYHDGFVYNDGYQQTEEEVEAEDDQVYCAAGVATSLGDASESAPAVSETADPSNSPDQEPLDEELEAKIAARRAQWEAENMASPDDFRNMHMDSTATPAQFRERADVEYAPSEASTDIDMEEVRAVMLDNPFEDEDTLGIGSFEPPAVIPVTDVELAASVDEALTTVGDEGEVRGAEQSQSVESLPEETPAADVHATTPSSSGAESTSEQIELPVHDSDQSSVSSIDDDDQQMPKDVTPLTPLSPAFPAALKQKDASPEPEPAELHDSSAAVSNDADNVTNTEIVDIKFSSGIVNDDASATLAADPLEPASKEDDTMKVILYEPRPTWYKVLMLFVRMLKCATTLFHKGPGLEPLLTEETAPQQANINIPIGSNLITEGPDFNEDYFDNVEYARAVGEQGIKLANAAVAVGMLPVKTGVQMGMKPIIVGRWGLKLGRSFWKQCFRRDRRI